ncbi:hypothetical protein KY306_02760 [Candidatus Woesearchaeota archaeon]|nr:hypothetical protein [Candidatus Woesearchaeota archaeon]
MATKDKLDKVLFSYTTQNNQLEEENQTLKEYISRLEEELKHLKTPSLMICDVASVIDKNQAIIHIPNGNKFLCHIASDCEPLKSGDQVLVEQKNLNIIRKAPVTKNSQSNSLLSWKNLNKPGLKSVACKMLFLKLKKLLNCLY